jgi:hypothetical protein
MTGSALTRPGSARVTHGTKTTTAGSFLKGNVDDEVDGDGCGGIYDSVGTYDSEDGAVKTMTSSVLHQHATARHHNDDSGRR